MLTLVVVLIATKQLNSSAFKWRGQRNTSANTPQWLCPRPDVEPLLRSIVGGLFAEGLVPPGSVIDAGANSGEESCYYAERQPQRVVHAVEPVLSNVLRIQQRWGTHLSNLRVLRGGLGNVNRLVRDRKAGVKSFGQGSQVTEGNMGTKQEVDLAAAADKSDTVFRVYRVDDLFANEFKGERLGFAHFDVEGGELDLVQGAHATIMRDRPVFTVEVHVHNKPNETLALLHAVRALGYRSYLVEEQCGVPVDCRNIINLPRESNSFRSSAILDFATSSGKLVAVSDANIATKAYAAACAFGSVCCPHGPPCCYSTCVSSWLRTLVGAKAASMHATRPFMNRAAALRNLFHH